MASFRALRTQYASLLKPFIASTRDFEILTSIPADRTPPAEILYVLDSSFNPPTFAHLRIASTALQERLQPSSRLILLLSTQNADKPSKPAPFEDRLAMMELFAHDLRSHLAKAAGASLTQVPEYLERMPAIDIAVTTHPYFVDKATAIEASNVYPSPLEQVHLTGYDTLIRILNPKYYPPNNTLEPLASLFSKHRFRVTLRPGNDWGDREEQEEYLGRLARGDRESEGGQREWAKKIQLIEGRAPGAPSVSSTKAREAAQCAVEDLKWLVPESVRQFVLSERPYSEES